MILIAFSSLQTRVCVSGLRLDFGLVGYSLLEKTAQKTWTNCNTALVVILLLRCFFYTWSLQIVQPLLMLLGPVGFYF